MSEYRGMMMRKYRTAGRGVPLSSLNALCADAGMSAFRRWAVGLALLLGSTPAETAPVPAVDPPTFVAKGTLRVLAVMDPHRPEFFSTSASHPGFDREILESFARLHQVRLEVVAVPGWDALVPALLEGRGDVIAGRFSATEARRKLIDFTVEVFPTRNVVLTRRPAAPVTTLEELRARKVGVTKGTSMVEVLAAAGVTPADDGIEPGGYPDALRSGRIGAAVWGIESAIPSQREDPEIQLGMFLGPPGTLAYGVRKGDRQLLAALNEFLQNTRRTPAWGRSVVKYFGDTAPEILRKARTE